MLKKKKKKKTGLNPIRQSDETENTIQKRA